MGYYTIHTKIIVPGGRCNLLDAVEATQMPHKNMAPSRYVMFLASVVQVYVQYPADPLRLFLACCLPSRCCYHLHLDFNNGRPGPRG